MKTKICSKCKRELPATREYFYKDKECLYGVSSICKECRGHRFGIFENNKVINGYKVCTKCNRNLPYTKEYFYSSGKDLRTVCKECQTKISKEQYHENIQHKREYARIWYKEKFANNQEKITKNRNRAKQWRIKNQGTERYKIVQNIKSIRRRSIKNKLLSTFTIKDWKDCKSYFNNECAYCGKHLNDLTQDHVIPVTKEGTYTKQNIISACKSCNSSKSNKDMEIWYRQQPFFSEKRLKKIYKWIGAENNVQQIKIT